MFRSTFIRFLAATCMTFVISALASAAHAATLTVTNTNDSGAGSLRQAIASSNISTFITDTIEFNIPGAGVHVISPASALPTITDTATIDGYSQSGASPNTLSAGSNAVILIRIDGISAGAGTSGLGICADDVTIQGLSITGYAQRGINVGQTTSNVACASAPSGALITGNFIGLAPDGGDQGNDIGVLLVAPATIGGTQAAQRNLISGNNASGLNFNSALVAGSSVLNNLIGTDPTGFLDRGAATGIVCSTSAADVTVGTASAPNTIAFNATGVRVVASATGNRLFANHYFANDALGIDLIASGGLPDGVTPNDADDADSGGNNLQNFPVLTAVSRTATGIQVSGTLDRPAGSTIMVYTIAVYANSTCDPSGNGEGERFLGTFAFASINGSQQTFTNATVATTESLPVGTVLATTATDPNGNTSEFSSCFALDNASPLVVTNTADSGTGSLRQAILNANAQAGGDTITFNIPGAGVNTIAPLSALPIISEAVTIDGYSQPNASPNTSATDDNAVILIEIDGSNAGAFVGLSVCADNVTIRGLSVDRFAKHGIAFGEQPNLASCTQNPLSNGSLLGDFVGLTPSGAAAGNQLSGVVFEDTSGRIGSAAAADRNVMSANLGSGIVVGGSVSVDGNLIGTGISPTSARGNGQSGVSVETLGAVPVSVGAQLPNTIRFNREGLRVSSAMSGTTSKANFAANDISNNTNLGIDLVAGTSAPPDGVTPNDADDADAGSNNLQNFPVLASALQLGATLRVSGSLDVPAGFPTQPYILAFYSNATCDGSGNGEGELFLGTVNKSITNSTENFTVELTASAPIGSKITSTATFNGSTSEFSGCLTLVDGDPLFKDSFE